MSLESLLETFNSITIFNMAGQGIPQSSGCNAKKLSLHMISHLFWGWTKRLEEADRSCLGDW